MGGAYDGGPPDHEVGVARDPDHAHQEGAWHPQPAPWPQDNYLCRREGKGLRRCDDLCLLFCINSSALTTRHSKNSSKHQTVHCTV